MSRLALLLGGAAIAMPASAQHMGHMMPGMVMPAPAPAKKAAKPKPKAKAKASAAKSARKAAPSRHQHPAGPPPSSRPAQTAPQHDMHDMGSMPVTGDMQGMSGMHDMGSMHAGHDLVVSEVPVLPPPPAALGGPEHAADTAFDQQAMAQSRHQLAMDHGGMTFAKTGFERAEIRFGRGRDGWLLDGEAWFGGDLDKAVIKLEGDGVFGRSPDHAEAQLLWSRAIAPYFDVQAGVRGDAEPKARGRFVLGVEGLAPYWIHVDAAAFLATTGQITGRAELSHDARITQRLVLQPRIEIDFALQRDRAERVGSGLTSAAAGLRLGFKLAPSFIPYVGVEYGRRFGRTADFARLDGGHAGEGRVLLGLRTFF